MNLYILQLPSPYDALNLSLKTPVTSSRVAARLFLFDLKNIWPELAGQFKDDLLDPVKHTKYVKHLLTK